MQDFFKKSYLSRGDGGLVFFQEGLYFKAVFLCKVANFLTYFYTLKFCNLFWHPLPVSNGKPSGSRLEGRGRWQKNSFSPSTALSRVICFPNWCKGNCKSALPLKPLKLELWGHTEEARKNSFRVLMLSEAFYTEVTCNTNYSLPVWIETFRWWFRLWKPASNKWAAEIQLLHLKTGFSAGSSQANPIYL